MTSSTAGKPRRRIATGETGRPTELRLASLHLRVGMLTLARAELESMAGEGTLDDDALLDLAEARWRTGDLSGAGDAATAYLETGRGSTLAFVIAAEAQAALGRPAEARRLVAQALRGHTGPLDPVFAGMPRASIWPSDTATVIGAASSPAETVSAETHPGADAGADTLWSDTRTEATEALASADAEAAMAPVPSIPEPVALPDGPTQLDAARAALAAGDVDAAAVRFALVLRVAPKLAPA
ncbi:MAG TPA: hypothetical protein VK656_02280, partial [Candidatus Acidoferrum sp.]|nr:hypothetical protein [Candidatus Acidoferrum sp.]